MSQKARWIRIFISALKIAVGSCIAIYIAESFRLDYATSAGSITLLTLVTTKWETLRLSVFRIITFVLSVLLAAVLFPYISSTWLAYGLFVFGVVMICEGIGWRVTVSINAVIGIHFLTTRDFHEAFIMNEFYLVLIGITVAIILNLFQPYQSQKKNIVNNILYTEEQFQRILTKMASYLSNEPIEGNVWDDIIALEKRLHHYVEGAYEYQENTFHAHPQYYINYFEMRSQQCSVLHNLHYEMRRMKHMPEQARIVAAYMLYMRDFVKELNVPQEQLQRLREIFATMEKEDLPKSREEFESRALLYHVLMDLEEFLVFKRRFVEQVDDRQKEIYWKKEKQ